MPRAPIAAPDKPTSLPGRASLRDADRPPRITGNNLPTHGITEQVEILHRNCTQENLLPEHHAPRHSIPISNLRRDRPHIRRRYPPTPMHAPVRPRIASAVSLPHAGGPGWATVQAATCRRPGLRSTPSISAGAAGKPGRQVPRGNHFLDSVSGPGQQLGHGPAGPRFRRPVMHREPFGGDATMVRPSIAAEFSS